MSTVQTAPAQTVTKPVRHSCRACSSPLRPGFDRCDGCGYVTASATPVAATPAADPALSPPTVEAPTAA